jgi:hypothetical protein
MTNEPDHYAILGVLPDAQQVVVQAAYRALAQMYHPDRWKGDASEANRRMADLNVAYAVLGDPSKRKQYDSVRAPGSGKYEAHLDEKDAAFDAALGEVEGRWKLAVDIFPDLADIRRRLMKTSHRLAFGFVTVMLEVKQFENRNEVADELERKFLESYFGTDQRVISYAKALIFLGLKDAVAALNGYVDVLGSAINPEPLIAKIESDFKVEQARLAAKDAAGQPIEDIDVLRKIAKLRRTIDSYPNSEAEAVLVASLLGYEVVSKSNGIFSSMTIEVRVRKSNELIATFDSPVDLSKWILTRH